MDNLAEDIHKHNDHNAPSHHSQGQDSVNQLSTPAARMKQGQLPVQQAKQHRSDQTHIDQKQSNRHTQVP